jgi:hypothetical protein
MINIARAVTAARLHLDNGMVVSEADAKLICEALAAANGTLGRLREASARMAEDYGLWFRAETAAEAYVQQELRKLCALIEAPVAGVAVREQDNAASSARCTPIPGADGKGGKP